MNIVQKTLLIVLAVVTIAVVLLWGRQMYGPMNEDGAINYVSDTLDKIAVDGMLVYRKQKSIGCADEFSGWIKEGRNCQYDGDAIYVLSRDQVSKLGTIDEKIQSQKYRLTSKNRFTRDSIEEMTSGKGKSLGNSYYLERGASDTVLSISLSSGEFLMSKDAGGNLMDVQKKVGRESRPNEYFYEISVMTNIPASLVED